MFVAFGVGGAGLVLGAVTGFLAMSKHSDLSNSCTNGNCPATSQSDVDSYHTMALLSTVGFVVAGVGAAAGVVLLVTQPKSAPAQSAWVSPYVGVGTVGAVGRF